MAIVGAGFLGSEVAAVARELGLNVTLIDPLPAPMIRRFGDHAAQLLAELHIQHGVQLRPGTAVTGLTSRDGRVTGVDLDNGVHVPADLVPVAIGSIPAVGWLADSGLNLGRWRAMRSEVPGRPRRRRRRRPRLLATPPLWAHARRTPDERHRTRRRRRGNSLGGSNPVRTGALLLDHQYDVKIQAYGLTGHDDDARGQGVGAALLNAASRSTPTAVRAAVRADATHAGPGCLLSRLRIRDPATR
ncbi:FAD-dependent oxidoreductase [Nonomuraea roseola]|uniref:FAD-dependent oxidoreductase n=1 Tax=Nonomuraea roseola TaxID=46179 RepID=A0ABV5Q864_9ACTN